jgi:beta-lactamase class A
MGTLLAALVAFVTFQHSAASEITRIIELSGAEVSIVFQPLGPAADGRSEFSRDAGKIYHAASTMKVPVMIELFRRVDANELKLDDTIIVTNVFHSIVDGSEYTLSATADSDGEVYKAIGKPMSYRALCEAMITVSSNLATNILIEKLDAKKIQATVNRLNAPDMKVLRGVEDQKAFDKGLNNQTSARALAVLLTAIVKGTAASSASSLEMQAILKRQKFNDGIPAGLPRNILVGHKTGTITRIHHDAGIVYAAQPYVLVVMTRGMVDEKKSDLLIAEISRLIYESLNKATGSARMARMAGRHDAARAATTRTPTTTA